MRIAVPGASRRKRAATIVIAAAAASVAVAGCGGESRTGAGAGDVAGFIPAGSPIYVELSTDLGGAQWTQAIALAKKFPGYGDAMAELTKSLADEELDFETQIKPLLGSHAALGVFDFKGFEDSDPDPAVLGAIDLADGKEADFLKLIQSGKEPMKPAGQHDGVDLFTDEDNDVAAVLDGTALFSDSKENLTRAIDAHRGGESKTMAGSDRLDEAFAALPDEVLAQAFVDVGAIIKVGAATEQGKEVADQLAKSGLGADTSFGVALSTETSGIRLKAVALGAKGLQQSSQPFTPALLSKVPSDAVAYIGLRNAYGMVEQALKQARGADPEVDQALSQAKLVLPLLGVSLDDVKNLTSLEHAFVVTNGPKPGVVAALETADGANASKTLDKLRETVPALASQAGATKIPEFKAVDLANGVKGWQSEIDPDAGVVYGVDGNLALIGTLVDAVKQVQGPARTLADDPAFQAATRQMPSKVDFVAWVNGEQIFDALERFDLLEKAPKDVVANLRPLKNLAAWSVGGDTPTFEVFVTIE